MSRDDHRLFTPPVPSTKATSTGQCEILPREPAGSSGLQPWCWALPGVCNTHTPARQGGNGTTTKAHRHPCTSGPAVFEVTCQLADSVQAWSWPLPSLLWEGLEPPPKKMMQGP